MRFAFLGSRIAFHPGPPTISRARAAVTALAISTSAVRPVCAHSTTVVSRVVRSMAPVRAVHGTSPPNINVP